MGRPEFLRARTQSTRSQRLSLDSVGDPGGNDQLLRISKASFRQGAL